MGKPNISEETIALLWENVEECISKPDEFNMGTYGCAYPSCDSPCCLAGRICFNHFGYIPPSGVGVKAGNILGLDWSGTDHMVLSNLFTRTFMIGSSNLIDHTNLRERVKIWLNTGE